MQQCTYLQFYSTTEMSVAGTTTAGNKYQFKQSGQKYCTTPHKHTAARSHSRRWSWDANSTRRDAGHPAARGCHVTPRRFFAIKTVLVDDKFQFDKNCLKAFLYVWLRPPTILRHTEVVTIQPLKPKRSLDETKELGVSNNQLIGTQKINIKCGSCLYAVVHKRCRCNTTVRRSTVDSFWIDLDRSYMIMTENINALITPNFSH